MQIHGCLPVEIERNPPAVAAKVAAKIGFPCFLKPNNGGSSVGTSRADDLESLTAALSEVSTYDSIVIIEEFLVAGRLKWP